MAPQLPAKTSTSTGAVSLRPSLFSSLAFPLLLSRLPSSPLSPSLFSSLLSSVSRTLSCCLWNHALPLPLIHSSHASSFAEREVQEELVRIWRKKKDREVLKHPSFAQIPRFYVKKTSSTRAAASHSSSAGVSLPVPIDESKRPGALMEAEMDRLVRHRLQEHMMSLVLEPSELDECWRLLRAHASPPASPTDERINYDGFCQVAEAMPPRASEMFFCASHFLRLPLDQWGRISVLHFFQWLRCKNALLRTRAELSMYDTSADGTLSERELEQWVSDLIPQLPALQELRDEFAPFYKQYPSGTHQVTAVRKFFFFLDPKRRGRISLHKLLSSPIMHELLELRRNDITPDELAYNW
eukprot:scaffold255186_cov29-Tisochrysis_lutea.AAC.2